ncbi:MAG: serine/threonine protein kinase [Mariniblastus sp.]|jgi:serine/threonine protein kinase
MSFSEADIFERARLIQSIETRNEFLDQVCPDADVRKRLERLLAKEQDDSFLEGPAIGRTTLDQGLDLLGTTIGHYKLLELIGEGGMGTVYLAQQFEPVKRRVALKVIKSGMDSKQVVARFEAERQALALMEHPNIAKFYDSGTTPSGNPYFVMEYVPGLTVTRYCDENLVSIEDRLQLFRKICQAVQHAHQKGVIHRDLKPSNILIKVIDDEPVPKIIDFGLAKATGSQLTDITMFTQFGQIIGTLEYMSPEQSQMNHLEVDTRTDIYSLGVLLYELLTGTAPFDRKRMRSVALDHVLKIIREEEPPKPSLRLSTLESMVEVASHRHTEPKRLGLLLRGDLDCIVMKAIEKDRDRRYETANGLGSDIQRFLDEEVVLACPPSPTYLARKFLLRHRAIVATMLAIAASLLIGIFATTWFAFKANSNAHLAQTRFENEKLAREEASQSEARAVKSESHATNEARRANNEASISKAVVEFINEDFLGQANPDEGAVPNITLRTVVDRAAEKVDDGRFQKSPLVAAAIHHTLGSTYLGLGEYEQAKHHSKRAVEIRARELGLSNRETIESTYNHSMSIYRQGKYADAENSLRELFMRSKVAFGNEDQLTFQIQEQIADCIHRQRQYEQAASDYRALIKLYERLDLKAESATLKYALGMAVRGMGNYDEAVEIIKQSVEECQLVFGKHPETASAIHYLGVTLYEMKNHEDALIQLQEAYQLRVELLGGKHPQTIETLIPLVHLHEKMGHQLDSLPVFQRFMELDDTESEKIQLYQSHYFSQKAKTGDWKTALKGFKRKIELDKQKDEQGRAYDQRAAALLYVETGNLEAYHQQCKTMFGEFSKSDDAGIRAWISVTCAILPGTTIDLELLQSFADSAVEVEDLDPGARVWLGMVKALVIYRRGDFEAAIVCVNEFDKDRRVVYPSAALLLTKAMAEHRLKHGENSKASLHAAKKLMKERFNFENVAPEKYWGDWLRCQILFREATHLIEGPVTD